MKLRPHHLLCINNYVGKGYSEDFTANMDKTVAGLKNGCEFTLVNGPDDLCAHCPFCGGECKTKEKTDRYDKTVTDVLGLEYGKTYKYAGSVEKANREIIKSGKFDAVCPDCEWFSLCKNVISSKKSE